MVRLVAFNQRHLCRRAERGLESWTVLGRYPAQRRGSCFSASFGEKNANPTEDLFPHCSPGGSVSLAENEKLPSSSGGDEGKKAGRMSITIRSPPSRPPAWRSSAQELSSSLSSSDFTSIPLGLDPSFIPLAEEFFSVNEPLGGEGGMGLSRDCVKPFVEPIKRIILVRTGKSAATEDLNRYVETPDWGLPLLEEGKQQAMRVGKKIADLVGEDPLYFYFSPYIRSRQTLRFVLDGYDAAARTRKREACYAWWEAPEEAKRQQQQQQQQQPQNKAEEVIKHEEKEEDISSSSLERGSSAGVEKEKVHDHNDHDHHNHSEGDHATNKTSSSSSSFFFSSSSSSSSGGRIVGMSEDVRLRDGDIGRYKSAKEFLFHQQAAEGYGRFFYRFPFGESGADVCDRATSFLDAFQRERVRLPTDTNVIIITHGLTLQMLIKRWFHLTVETFHSMRAPPSGTMAVLTRLHHQSRYRLNEKSLEIMGLPFSLNEHNGYKYRNKRLLGSMSSGAPYM